MHLRQTLLFAMLLAPLTTAHADERIDKMASALFPTTANWTSAPQLTALKAETILPEKDRLAAAYWNTFHARYLNDSGLDNNEHCSFFLRVFKPEYSTGSIFYRYDFNGDGQDDILYSGSAQCAEGELSVLWLRTAAGYQIAHLGQGMLVRFRVDAKPALLLYQVGCCGDPVARYTLTSSPDEDGFQQVAFVADTETPRALLENPLRTTLQAFSLRRAPNRDDAYSEGASSERDMAVFGTEVTRYLAGASVLITARQAGDDKQDWCFGLVSASSNILRITAPYQVHAGWFECGAAQPQKSS